MFGLGRHDESALLNAAQLDDIATVKRILAAKVKLLNVTASRSVCREHPDIKAGETALHLACRRGHISVIKFLLSLKANVNFTNARGASPLHLAANAGKTQVLEMLTAAGADQDRQDSDGHTPLHGAVSNRKMACVQFLLRNGTDCNTKDTNGNTPLHEAMNIDSERILNALLKAGAKVDEKNAHGQTPLHMVIINTDHSAAARTDPKAITKRQHALQVLRLLLSHGADANAIDVQGDTPLDRMTYLEGDLTTDPIAQALRSAGGRWARHQKLNSEAAAIPQSSPKLQAATQTDDQSSKPKSSKPPKPHQRRSMQPIALGAIPIVIGREIGCQVRCHSLTLSRRHAQIELKDGEYVIQDLNSNNGVNINGIRIDGPHKLMPNDAITLGAYEFEFDGTSLVPKTGELTKKELEAERSRRLRHTRR